MRRRGRTNEEEGKEEEEEEMMMLMLMNWRSGSARTAEELTSLKHPSIFIKKQKKTLKDFESMIIITDTA